MPNIYDGINKMTDQEIRIQIAMLRNMTMLNVAKETGNRLLGGLTDLANAFSETFSRKTPFEYQTTKVSDRIEEEAVKLASKERVQLEYELKKALIERCNELLTEPLDPEIAEDQISVYVVTEAAKTYGMDKYLTQGRKIETIEKEFERTFLQTLHSILIRQTEAERHITDQAIQKRMNEVDMETKRELQRRLMPKEFSGRGIGRLLRLEKSTKYLAYTVELLGYECFDYINTGVTTIMNTVKGLKRLTRVLLAQFVWSAASAYGGTFVIAEDILPGYISVADREEESIKEKAFRKTLLDRQKAQKQLEKCDNALEKIGLQIADVKDRFELETREYDEAQMKFMGLESRKDDYINGGHSQEESKVYYADVNSSKRKLDGAESEYNKWKNKLHEAELQKKKLETERNTALLNLEVVKHKTDSGINEYAMELKRKWQAYFFRFQFEKPLYEQVVMDFTHEEQLRIEEMLKEMHDSRNMMAYAVETETKIPDGQETVQPEQPADRTSGMPDAGTHEDLESKLDGTLGSPQTEENTATDVNQVSAHIPESDLNHKMEVLYKTYVTVANGKNARITYQDHKILSIERS